MENILTYPELQEKVQGFFKENQSTDEVFVTEDGQVFLMENRASLFANANKMRYFQMRRETEVSKMDATIIVDAPENEIPIAVETKTPQEDTNIPLPTEGQETASPVEKPKVETKTTKKK